MYGLLKFTDDELEDSSDDPYKNADDPRNLIRFIDHLLKSLTNEIIGFLDSVQYTRFYNRQETIDFSLLSENKIGRFCDLISVWVDNFQIGELSKPVLSELITKLITDSTASGSFEILGSGLYCSILTLLELQYFERDSRIFVEHPDAQLDFNIANGIPRFTNKDSI